MIFFHLVFLKDFQMPFNGLQKNGYIPQLMLHIVLNRQHFLFPEVKTFFLKKKKIHYSTMLSIENDESTAVSGPKVRIVFKVPALNVVSVLYVARTKEGAMDIDLDK
jgi:hypothetical protein